MSYLRALLGSLAFAAIVMACAGGATELSTQLGGETTRADASRNAFGLPAPHLSNEERRLFERGDSFFTQNWVIAPASTDARDGLGPTFNAPACSSCHLLDGRGAPPDHEGIEARTGLLLRLSIPGTDAVTGAPIPDPVYGGQLQDDSVLGVPAEGSMLVEVDIITGTYADGTPYELLDPTYSITDLAFGDAHPDLLIGPRLAPQVFGMGLLEAIPAEDLLANADPDDTNNDGVSGRPNIVWDDRAGEKTLGRFGWKANVATVEQQVAGAFAGDIGITSALHPDENCPSSQTECAAAPNGNDGPEPELTDSRLEVVTFYNRTLAVPALRNGDNDDVRQGAELFAEIGCAQCHVDEFTTGETDIETLSNQTIHPYTDLLLHDMGEGLADGRPDFEATGQEWRTPPLWGLGLIDDVNGERFLLHDGRARTIEEAILWHGGEAESSTTNFLELSLQDRTKLLEFLESL